MASGIPQPLNRFINPLLGTAALENAVLGLILRPPSAAAHIVLAGAVRPPNDSLHSEARSEGHSEGHSGAAGPQRPRQRSRWSGAFLTAWQRPCLTISSPWWPRTMPWQGRCGTWRNAPSKSGNARNRGCGAVRCGGSSGSSERSGSVVATFTSTPTRLYEY